MIIKAIKQLFETQTSLLQKKAGTYTDEVVCSVDDDVVDCEKFKEPYIGVPAPVYLSDDEWFGSSSIKSEKQLDYMEKETEIKMQEEQRREEAGEEPENIHEIMYQIASKNWTTVGETQGRSENFQEGPGGWCSGNGYNQFRK